MKNDNQTNTPQSDKEELVKDALSFFKPHVETKWLAHEPPINLDSFDELFSTTFDRYQTGAVLISTCSSWWFANIDGALWWDKTVHTITRILLVCPNIVVRHIMVYDLPSDLGFNEQKHQQYVQQHRRAIADLSWLARVINNDTGIANFGSLYRYEPRMLVWPRIDHSETYKPPKLLRNFRDATAILRDPRDPTTIRSSRYTESEWAVQFHRIWESNLLIGEYFGGDIVWLLPPRIRRRRPQSHSALVNWAL